MNAWTALLATAFAVDLAVRPADVDASVTNNTGDDCPGLKDAHIPGAAAFHQLLRGVVKAIAKQLP